MAYKRSPKATETTNIRVSKKAYKLLKRMALDKEMTLLKVVDALVKIS